MVESDDHLSLDDADQAIEFLARRLEEFAESWERSETPPVLGEFLTAAGTVRRLLLVELIKVDLEYRWLIRNLPKRIDHYIDEHPELAEGSIPADLIYEEFHIRRKSGSPADPQEYLDGFPDQAVELRCLLDLDLPYCSSAVYSMERKEQLETLDLDEEIDDFTLLAELGQGAFARVFLARQESMQRLVALKISADQGSEPQMLAQLDHDYIVRVFDQRHLPERRLRLLYMQYVAGGTLQSVVRAVQAVSPGEHTGRLLFRAIDDWLEQRGEMRPAESETRQRLIEAGWSEVVGWIGARLASALDYAHRRGILHRDLKPANVLLTAEGIPKLADFNISFSSRLNGATPAAYFGGSLAYMSPEQLEACNPAHERQPDSLDGCTDVYSLGIVLWELLTGYRPFRDEKIEGCWGTTIDTMTARRRAGVGERELAALRSVAHPALVRVLTTCLAADVRDRWQTAAELQMQLELCTKPRARQLLAPGDESWRVRCRPYALLILLVVAAIPNGLAGFLNFVYNDIQIIGKLPQNAQPVFWKTQAVINSIAYPIGLGAFLYLGSTVVCALRMGRAGNISGMAKIRRRGLRLGHSGALIGVSLWALAGVVYPTVIHLCGVDLPLEGYFHFFGSLFVCGLIAASYPFFAVSLFCVRVLYSGLLQNQLAIADDRRVIAQLGRFLWVYALMAALVPFCGITAVVFVRPEARSALLVISSVGILGLPIVFWLFRQIQSDLEVLQDVMSRG